MSNATLHSYGFSQTYISISDHHTLHDNLYRNFSAWDSCRFVPFVCVLPFFSVPILLRCLFHPWCLPDHQLQVFITNRIMRFCVYTVIACGFSCSMKSVFLVLTPSCKPPSFHGVLTRGWSMCQIYNNLCELTLVLRLWDIPNIYKWKCVNVSFYSILSVPVYFVW